MSAQGKRSAALVVPQLFSPNRNRYRNRNRNRLDFDPDFDLDFDNVIVSNLGGRYAA